MTAPVDAVLLHQLAEGAPLLARETRSDGDVPVRLGEHVREIGRLEGREGARFRRPQVERPACISRQARRTIDAVPNLLTIGQEQLTVDPVLQLTDVARPLAVTQPLPRGRMEPLGSDPVLGAEKTNEVVGQQLDIFRSAPQRRNPDLEDIQTIEEISPESSDLDQPEEVLIGGGNDPHVRGDLRRRPHRPVLEILEKS